MRSELCERETCGKNSQIAELPKWPTCWEMTYIQCPKLAVIGAGVVGLSTALQLKLQLPEAHVTVIADRFGPDTTSDGAGGIWRMYRSKVPGVSLDVFRQWLHASWTHYHNLTHSAEASEAGCRVVSGLELYNTPPETTLQREIVYSHEPCSPKELQMYPGNKYKYGYRFTALMVECRSYLPYLTRRFTEKGGILVKKKIGDLSELVGQYDCVIVCTGFGSKELLKDDKMFAVRGHLIRVSAPWLKQYLYVEDEDKTCTYIYPGQNNVIVGGTRQVNDEDPSPREEDQQAIWSRACRLIPSLKKADILWSWVGLRPTRSPLRLEKDTLKFPAGELQVVYHYGHGGEGVSLSWGTAVQAVELVKDVLRQSKKVLPAKL